VRFRSNLAAAKNWLAAFVKWFLSGVFVFPDGGDESIVCRDSRALLSRSAGRLDPILHSDTWNLNSIVAGRWCPACAVRMSTEAVSLGRVHRPVGPERIALD